MRRRRAISRFWLSLLLTLLLLQTVVHPAYGSSYSDEILSDAPYGYFRLNEFEGTTAANSSGSMYGSGTYTGGPILGYAGAIIGDSDTAVSFETAGSYLALQSTWLAGMDFSVEMWIVPPGGAGGGTLFDAYSGSGAGEEISLTVGSGMLAFTCNGSTVSTSSGIINDGVWTHIVATYSNSTNAVALYVNGSSMGSGTAGPFIGSSPVVDVGAANGGAPFWGGRVDELALYLTALDSSTVLSHYQYGIGLGATSTPGTTATAVLTPTPAPWALATIPGTGITYQVTYEASVGDGLQFIALLLLVVLSFVQTLIAIANRR